MSDATASNATESTTATSSTSGTSTTIAETPSSSTEETVQPPLTKQDQDALLSTKPYGGPKGLDEQGGFTAPDEAAVPAEGMDGGSSVAAVADSAATSPTEH